MKRKKNRTMRRLFYNNTTKYSIYLRTRYISNIKFIYIMNEFSWENLVVVVHLSACAFCNINFFLQTFNGGTIQISVAYISFEARYTLYFPSIEICSYTLKNVWIKKNHDFFMLNICLYTNQIGRICWAINRKVFLLGNS